MLTFDDIVVIRDAYVRLARLQDINQRMSREGITLIAYPADLPPSHEERVILPTTPELAAIVAQAVNAQIEEAENTLRGLGFNPKQGIQLGEAG